MSYDVAIVVPPIAQDDKDAWDEVMSIIDLEGSPPPILKEFYDLTVKRYPCNLSYSVEDLDKSVWSVGPLWKCFAARAAHIPIGYPSIEEVLPFLVDTANSLGLVLFDMSSTEIYRGDGIKGLTLSVENRRIVMQSPSIRQINAAVDQLTPCGGPSFLLVDGPGDDYAQVAGGDGAYTVEWRQYSESGFRHWVAGDSSLPSDSDVKIPTNGFHVAVREDEQLNANDVKEILNAFALGTGRLDNYSWRDITDKFV